MLKAAAIEAATAAFINMIISIFHGFFYDPQKYESRELYEVKTRKILSISNLIASSSNVIWTGGNVLAGNEFAWENVDIGGLIITAHACVKCKKKFLVPNAMHQDSFPSALSWRKTCALAR